MLNERYKKLYENWKNVESDFSDSSGREMVYFDHASNIIPIIDRTFEECGYTKHGVEFTLYICGQGYGMELGLDKRDPKRKREEAHRRQVVAEFLRELAEKIESGEC